MNTKSFQEKYSIESEVAVTRTYSLTMQHITKVAEMAEQVKISQSEIVRRAIDLLYEQIKSQDQPEFQVEGLA